MQPRPLDEQAIQSIERDLATHCRRTPRVVYATPSERVGKHEWTFVVYEGHPIALRDSGRFTSYYWRRIQDVAAFGPSRWQCDKQWPSYDSNDGMYAGCPHSIVAIYDKYLAAIDEALGRTRTNAPKQVALF